MSTTSLPFMPFFGGDFLRVTSGWSLEERGALLMLEIAQWENGYLPTDPIRLARIAQIDSETFSRVWPIVSAQFVQMGPGLINEALAELREKSQSRAEVRSRKARHAATERWQRD